MDSAREHLSRLRAYDQDTWMLIDLKMRRRLESFFRRRIGGDLELDLELAQETLVRASEKIHDFDPEKGSLERWIFGIARNLFKNRLRAQARRKEVSINAFVELLWEEDAPDGPDPAETSELREEIRWALARLSERQRAIFIAFEESGLSLAEIASARGCTVVAVKGALFQARKNLRELLLARNPDLAADYAPASMASTRFRRVRR